MKKAVKVSGAAVISHWDKIRSLPLCAILRSLYAGTMKNLFVIALFLCAVIGLSVARRNQGRSRRRSCTPRDCVLYEWSTFRNCSKTCGGGYLVQRRRIKQKPSCGGNACPFYCTSQRRRRVSCGSGTPGVLARVAVFPNKPERCVLHESPSAEERRVRVDGVKREAVILECKLTGFPFFICIYKKFLWAGSILLFSFSSIALDF